MKALPRPRNENDKSVRQMKKRILINIDRITEAKNAICTTRVIAFACITMYKRYGYGRKRIQQFYEALCEEMDLQHRDMKDTGNDMLYAQLREMGLDKLIDDIEKAYDYYEDSVNNGFFEGADEN